MLKVQHILPRSKEIQEQMRNKIVDIYQSGKAYKAISKALRLQRTTVRAIIHTLRKLGTVVNLLGWLSQSPYLIQLKCCGMTLNRPFMLENPTMWLN